MKFAQVGYGSQGQGAGREGEGFTYLVSDTVRTGQTLTPVVKHAGNGKIFVTTGVVLTKGIKSAKGTVSTVDGKVLTQDDITRAYTGKELGVSKKRGIGGKFEQEKSYHDWDNNYIVGQGELERRAKSVAVYNKEQLDKGKQSEFSEGKATQAAIDELSKYETYEDYMARTQKRSDK